MKNFYMKIILLCVCLAGISCSTTVTPNANGNANAGNANTKNASAEKPKTQANTEPKPNDTAERVAFAKGATKKTVRALIDKSKRYSFNALEGQILEVTVTQNPGKVDVSLEKGDADIVRASNGFTAKLKKDGEYVILVENTGDKPVEITLTIEINEEEEDIGEEGGN